MPSIEIDCHCVRCIHPAAIDENRSIGARLFQRSDDVNARRSVSRSIRENDFVLVIVHALEVHSSEMSFSGIPRELFEVDGFGFSSRSQLPVQSLPLLQSRELPEPETYADDCEDDSKYSKNLVSCFHKSLLSSAPCYVRELIAAR